MKYIVSWQTRQNATEEMQARGLQVFSKWSPAESSTFHEFVARVDGRGGYAVVETDDITNIAKDTALFGAFFDMDVVPVIDVTDSAAITGEAVALRASIT